MGGKFRTLSFVKTREKHARRRHARAGHCNVLRLIVQHELLSIRKLPFGCGLRSPQLLGSTLAPRLRARQVAQDPSSTAGGGPFTGALGCDDELTSGAEIVRNPGALTFGDR